MRDGEKRSGFRRRGKTDSRGAGAAPPGRRLVLSLAGRKRARAGLARISELRGDDPQQTAEQVMLNLLRSVPRTMDGYQIDFGDLEVAASGFEAGHPWLRTKSGRIFYDHPATAKDALMYVLLRDLAPDEVDVETLVVAANAIRRYVHGTANMPEGTRVAVDAGCYVGYKALAYADRVGADGKVVAVEMMPDNYELLCQNVEANGLSDRIATVNCGLSDRTGKAPARRFRKQQATIADDLDQLGKFKVEREVPVDTLENVFDRTLGDRDVDFLNVQVNGNELAVLEGLGRWTHRVKSFSVTSPYSRHGKRIRDQVVEWFRAHQIPVTDVGETWVRAQTT